MPFAESLATAIELAPKRDLDHLASQLWKAFDNGTLDEDAAQSLAEQLEDRRRSTPPPRPKLAPAASARRPPRPPDRQASIERRRRLAASGPMPPALAAQFTTSGLAVLGIVADEVRHRGYCDRSIPEIAARAGVCERGAQTTIRLAEALGLLTVTERRLSAFRNDTNVVHIISPEWRTWLRLADKGGCKPMHRTQQSFRNSMPKTAATVPGYRPKRLGEGRYRPTRGP
jgi:hypothetical protein